MAGIEAVIVNHNTSLFSELALRSLVAASPGATTITVVDNHSDDAPLTGLKEACDEVGASFELSRFPLHARSVNTHGDVLRDFVLARPDASHYLFVDADIDFDEPDVVATMLDDFKEDVWAVQARFRSAEEKHGNGASMNIWAGREVTLRPDDGLRGRGRPRCHPGCALVPNAPTFRRVADVFGFSCAILYSQDPEHAAWFDTMSLASAAMDVAGYRCELSRATVHHFFNASYDDKWIAEREKDCRERLARFGRG